MNPLTSPFQSAIYKPNKPAKPAMPVGGKYVGASSPILTERDPNDPMAPRPLAPGRSFSPREFTGGVAAGHVPGDGTRTVNPSPQSPPAGLPEALSGLWGQLKANPMVQSIAGTVGTLAGEGLRALPGLDRGAGAALSRGIQAVPGVVGAAISPYRQGGVNPLNAAASIADRVPNLGSAIDALPGQMSGSGGGSPMPAVPSPLMQRLSPAPTPTPTVPEEMQLTAPLNSRPQVPAPAPQPVGLIEALGGMAQGLGQRIAGMPGPAMAQTEVQAPRVQAPATPSPIPQERDMTQFMTPEVLARRNASIADRERQAAELAGVRERLGQTSDMTGSNVQPGVDEDFLDRLRGSKLNGDALAQRELRNTGIGGVSRGGRYSGGDTAYSGSAFSEYDTPRPSTFSAERRDAAIAAIKNGTIGPAKNSIDIDPTRTMSPLQQELFADNKRNREDRRQYALQARVDQHNARVDDQREARRAYDSNPLNNPVVQQTLRNAGPVAAAAMMGQIMSNQGANYRADLEAGIQRAELGQRGTEFQTTTGLKTKKLDANIQTAADNLALAKTADERAGKTAESQATLTAADAEYKKAQADKIKKEADALAGLSSQEALARQTRIDLVQPEVDAGVKTSEEANDFINQTTPTLDVGQGPAPIAQAAVQLPREERGVQPLFPEPVADMGWRDIAGSLLDRINTPAAAPTDADIAKVQRYVQTRSRLEPNFDGELGVLENMGFGNEQVMNARSDLMKLLLGTEPITAAKVKELTRKK